MHELYKSTEPRYDLSPDEQTARTADFVSAHPELQKADRSVVCCLVEGDMQDVARTVERVVFEDSFGNDAAEMRDIYGKYENASQFFLSIDTETMQPVGALRVIENSDAGLMTFSTLPAEATDLDAQALQAACDIESLDACWDVGTVAVPPEFRKQGAGISVQLYRAMYVAAMQKGVQHLVAIIDKVPLETMTTFLGIPFERIPHTAPFAYEGSGESSAVYGYVPKFYDTMRQKMDTPEGQMAREYLLDLVEGRGDGAIFVGNRDEVAQ